MSDYQRARQPEQKQERRQAILDTALHLWLESSYAEFTMARLAELAGLGKGTLYVYFSTKEQLFLTLLEEMLILWLEDVCHQLQPQLGKGSAEEVARILTRSLSSREPLMRLLSLSEGVLEHEIDDKTAYGFKQRLLAPTKLTSEVLEQCLPNFQVGDGVRLLVYTRALLTGLRQMANSPMNMQQVIKNHAELELYRVYQVQFEREFEIGLLALIQGLIALGAKSSTKRG